MPIRYTEKERKDLRIAPNKKGLVTAHDAATILTWRAWKEQKVRHEYTVDSIRGRVECGDLEIAEKLGPRRALYRIEDIFELTISPRRGLALKKKEEREEDTPTEENPKSTIVVEDEKE